MAYFDVTIYAGTEEHGRRYSSTVQGPIEEIGVDDFQTAGRIGPNQVAMTFGIQTGNEKTLALRGAGSGKLFSVSRDLEAARWLSQHIAKFIRNNEVVEDFSG
jgi:hypothetical protein